MIIVAEVGQNFCGDMELAKRLINLAQINGADLCKFQLYDHNSLYRNNPEVPDVALSFEQAKMLFEYGKDSGIEVFFSAFDVERVKWCEEIGVKRYKIACTMRNQALLEAVKDTGKPILISSNDEVFYWRDMSWLYCVPEYPAPLEHVKMPSFDSLSWHKWHGYSDHTIGLDAVKIALARGAQIVEKHFSIAHERGVDGAWSMTPSELKELVRWSKVCKEVLQ